MCLLPIHLQWLGVDIFRVLKANSNVKSTLKSNIHDVYYFRAFSGMNVRYAHVRSFPLSKWMNPTSRLLDEVTLLYSYSYSLV